MGTLTISHVQPGDLVKVCYGLPAPNEKFWCEVIQVGIHGEGQDPYFAVESLRHPLSQMPYFQFRIERSNIYACKQARKNDFAAHWQPRLNSLIDREDAGVGPLDARISPTEEKIRRIKPGDAVKVAMPHERFWCEVRHQSLWAIISV